MQVLLAPVAVAETVVLRNARKRPHPGKARGRFVFLLVRYGNPTAAKAVVQFRGIACLAGSSRTRPSHTSR